MEVLSSILSREISKSTDRQSEFERVFWFADVMRWIQRPRDREEKDAKKETIYTVRFKYILLLLNKNPQWKENFVMTISMLLAKISSPSQLTRAGLPETESFVQEFIHRLQEKILPKPPLSEDLSTLIYEIFPNEEESLYIDFIDVEVLTELFNLFKERNDLEKKLKVDLLAAIYVLGHQIQGYSLLIQNELNFLSTSPQELPEYQLEGLLRDHQAQQNFELGNGVFILLRAIDTHMEELHRQMQAAGVKIELVYLFQVQKRKINRLRILMQFLNQNVSTVMNFRYFISQLVVETQHKKSLTSFFSENLNLITDRIVQANSSVGEHYVTFDWIEFRRMFRSALGGGALTAVTVFIKHVLLELKLSGFIKGLSEGLNYSASFLAIYLMGFTLATKQPSATAPFIAQALKKSTTESRKSIVALLRTQFIAVLGNVGMVFPICFLVSWITVYLEKPAYTVEDAFQTIHSSNILGPSPLYAAFTGVLLFLASLFAGWFENWVTVNRIDKRIRYNDKLQKYIGQKRIETFAEFVKEKSNPLSANISLGLILGLAPVLMKFFGIPLEARHVTLSTGSFASALPIAIQAGGLHAWDIVNAVLGLLTIGLLNLSVSFALAFLLASISSQVKFSSFWRLLKWGMRLIFTKPWLLVVPEPMKASSVVVEEETR